MSCHVTPRTIDRALHQLIKNGKLSDAADYRTAQWDSGDWLHLAAVYIGYLITGFIMWCRTKNEINYKFEKLEDASAEIKERILSAQLENDQYKCEFTVDGCTFVLSQTYISHPVTGLMKEGNLTLQIKGSKKELLIPDIDFMNLKSVLETQNPQQPFLSRLPSENQKRQKLQSPSSLSKNRDVDSSLGKPGYLPTFTSSSSLTPQIISTNTVQTKPLHASTPQTKTPSIQQSGAISKSSALPPNVKEAIQRASMSGILSTGLDGSSFHKITCTFKLNDGHTYHLSQHYSSKNGLDQPRGMMKLENQDRPEITDGPARAILEAIKNKSFLQLKEELDGTQ
jgi:hypothetical protein